MGINEERNTVLVQESCCSNPLSSPFDFPSERGKGKMGLITDAETAIAEQLVDVKAQWIIFWRIRRWGKTIQKGDCHF